jgi:hypothetical protein
MLKKISKILIMRSFYDSFLVGVITTSTLVLGTTSSYIFGGRNCSEYFNDWKVFGTVASVGALYGSYYIKSNN